MSRLSKAFLIYMMAIFPIGLIAQNQNIEDRIEKVKRQRLKSGYEPWNFCFVDGLPKTQILTDSLNGFSISFPSSYNLDVLSKDGFRIMRSEPTQAIRDTNILMEVWAKAKDKTELEDIFYQAIHSHLKNETPFRIGTENINGEMQYWMETYNVEADAPWELTFYIRQPNTKSTILVKQKSFKKEEYRQDFCVYGSLIRSIKWL